MPAPAQKNISTKEKSKAPAAIRTSSSGTSANPSSIPLNLCKACRALNSAGGSGVKLSSTRTQIRLNPQQQPKIDQPSLTALEALPPSRCSFKSKWPASLVLLLIEASPDWRKIQMAARVNPIPTEKPKINPSRSRGTPDEPQMKRTGEPQATSRSTPAPASNLSTQSIYA